MACSGCARRRAKLKKLLDLANERFEELKQRAFGNASPNEHRSGNRRHADQGYISPGRINGLGADGD
ncbi:hypothetical protein D3C75_654140 [compost metagenome]